MTSPVDRLLASVEADVHSGGDQDPVGLALRWYRKALADAKGVELDELDAIAEQADLQR